MKSLLSALLMFLAQPAAALSASTPAVITEFGRGETSRIVVWGSTDLEALRPVIDEFLSRNSELSIEYHDMQSSDLYELIRDGRQGVPDLAISSAADLQVKLVNDGFALEHVPPRNVSIPDWARWRDQAFGIATEPAVLVYSRKLALPDPLPRTRRDLAEMILKYQDLLKGRVATYDIAVSGVGYLFATYDSFYSSTYTTLLQRFGQANVQFYCCSGEILDALDEGTMLVGYNILGSYALARQRRGGKIEIVLPEDYTLILSRVAIIPRGARHPELGAAFLDYLLSPEVQLQIQSYTSYSATEGIRTAGFTAHPIALNPSLLVFLDQIKKRRFLQTWRSLIYPQQRRD